MKTLKMVSLAAIVAGCGSSTSATPDAGETKADAAKPKTDGAAHADAKADAARDAGAPKKDAAQGVTRHLLVTYDGTGPQGAGSTMIATDLATKKVEGTLAIGDNQAQTDTFNASAPFVLGQASSTIELLNASTPWKTDGSWSVLPAGDAGAADDPYAVVVASETAAYVIGNLANLIDVIDLTSPTDAGKPTTTIDLASLVQPTDADGHVDAVAGVYVAGTKTLYVVLGNINTDAVADYMGSYELLCSGTVSTVVAIDTTTNALKAIADGGPGGAIALKGFNPVAAHYDAPHARILLLEAGCNPAPATDGGAPGTVSGRAVEELDLTTGTTKILLDLTTQPYPSTLAYVNSQQVVLGFSYPTYQAWNWNPTLSFIGTQIMSAPQVFAYDGNGNLVGSNLATSDAGMTAEVVSVSLTDGTSTTLVANALNGGAVEYIGSVGVWPSP